MKLALVTGGCRRLGAAIAARLATEGYVLALHATEIAEPNDELRALLESNDADWRGFAADFSKPEEIEQLIPTIVNHFGQAPDLLVNNAAQFGEDRPTSVSFEALMRHYSVNTAAPALLAKAFSAHGRRGVIINILDQRVANPHGDQLSYTLSKIALSGLTEILARELSPDIRVNAVAPGLTLPTRDYNEEQMEKTRSSMPLERLSQPPQIADAVVWLASAEAVTGQTIYVDGGAHLTIFERDFLHLD